MPEPAVGEGLVAGERERAGKRARRLAAHPVVAVAQQVRRRERCGRRRSRGRPACRPAASRASNARTRCAGSALVRGVEIRRRVEDLQPAHDEHQQGERGDPVGEPDGQRVAIDDPVAAPAPCASAWGVVPATASIRPSVARCARAVRKGADSRPRRSRHGARSARRPARGRGRPRRPLAPRGAQRVQRSADRRAARPRSRTRRATTPSARSCSPAPARSFPAAPTSTGCAPRSI